jgi:hypothetical protein
MQMLRRVGRWIAGFSLGLFVVWQLVFLLGLNLCEVTRHCVAWVPQLELTFPDLADTESKTRVRLDRAERVWTRWAEFTGQAQNWSLFAPNVWANVPFAAVELRWDEEPANDRAAPRPPVYLISDNEPVDVSSYFRIGLFRLRRYESSLDIGFQKDPDKSDEAMDDKWRQNIFDKVRREPHTIRAYLEWRWRRYHADHPDLETPKQIILHVRTYRIPPPPGPSPWKWAGPEDRPVARWRPGFAYPDGALPVEAYDLVAERYDVLP